MTVLERELIEKHNLYKTKEIWKIFMSPKNNWTSAIDIKINKD